MLSTLRAHPAAGDQQPQWGGRPARSGRRQRSPHPRERDGRRDLCLAEQEREGQTWSDSNSSNNSHSSHNSSPTRCSQSTAEDQRTRERVRRDSQQREKNPAICSAVVLLQGWVVLMSVCIREASSHSRAHSTVSMQLSKNRDRTAASAWKRRGACSSNSRTEHRSSSRIELAVWSWCRIVL